MRALGAEKINEKLKVVSYTKLMEQLDVCSEKNCDSNELPLLKHAAADIQEIQAVRDHYGCDHIFANHPGKGIIYYYLGTQISVTNGRFVPLYASGITAVIGSDGLACVFGLRGNEIYQSSGRSNGSFTPEVVHPVTLPKDFTRISQIAAIQLKQGYALFVVSETSNQDAFVTCCIDGEKYDYLLPIAFSTGKFGFSGTCKDDLRIHQVYASKYESFYATCMLFTKRLELFSLDFPARSSVCNMCICGDEVFCSDDARHVWKISASKGQAFLTELAEVDSKSSFLLQKSAGSIHVASIDKSSRLVHLKALPDGEKYASTAAFPIDTDVSAVSFCQYSDTTALYYYSKATASLIKLDYNEGGQNWNEMNFTIPDPSVIQRYSCYSTELTLLDPDKQTPLIEVPVEVWTQERTYIKTSAGLQLCDKEHKISLQTDLRGKVMLVQYTNKIDACVIYASLPETLLDSEQCLALRQFETVSKKMQKITADDILNAKTTDSMGTGHGTLLPDRYRTKENASAIAQSIEKVMALNTVSNDCPTSKGVYLISKKETLALHAICADGDFPYWSLRVDGDRLLYTNLADDEALKRIHQIKAQSVCLTRQEFNGLFSAIGDFFRSIVKKIVQVVQIIVKGVKTVVQFVIDSVTMVFEFVAKVIGEILDFVETIFAAVMVFFVAIFAWIAALFQWADVKRTQRVIEGSFDIFLDTFPTINNRVKNKLIGVMKEYETNLDKKIDDICSSLLPSTPVMGFVNENNPSHPAQEEELSNDYLLDKLVKTDLRAQDCFTSQEVNELSLCLVDVMELWMQLSADIAEDDAFKKVNKYFEDAFCSLDGLFDNLMVSILKLLQALLHLILNGMTALVSITFDAFESMISILDRLLKKKMDIPFFSSLYRLMTGDELSILNLISFIFAVPVVTLSKIMLGHSPYQNDGQVDATLSYFRSIFTFSGTANRTYLNKEGRIAFTVLSFCVGSAYNFLSGYLDYEPCTSRNDERIPVPASFLDYFTWALEFLWLAFSTPWIYETASDRVTEGGTALWSYFIAGVLLDGIFVFKSSHIDKSGWKGRCCTSLYGLGHFMLILAITREEKLAPEECIPDFCGGFTEFTKLLIDLDMNRSKEKSWCKFIIMSADIITGCVVLGCGITSAVEISKEGENNE